MFKYYFSLLITVHVTHSLYSLNKNQYTMILAQMKILDTLFYYVQPFNNKIISDSKQNNLTEIFIYNCNKSGIVPNSFTKWLVFMERCHYNRCFYIAIVTIYIILIILG